MHFKTSHKIALILLSVLLVVPILLIFAYQNEVSHNRYRTVGGGQSSVASTIIPPVKYVSVSGLGIECNIIRADSSYCLWPEPTLPGEFIGVNVKGDTLFITNRQSPSLSDPQYNGRTAYRTQVINVYLPALTQLTTQYANINLDSISTDLTIHAKNSLLNINRYDMPDPVQHYWYNTDGTPRREIDARTFTTGGITTQLFTTLDRLSIQADSTVVYVGNTSHIRNLEVEAKNSSLIEIREGAVIDQFRHQFDSTVKLKARWQYLEQLVINH